MYDLPPDEEIAALKPWEEEIKVVRIREKTADELKRARRVYRNATLVLSHGSRINP